MSAALPPTAGVVCGLALSEMAQVDDEVVPSCPASASTVFENGTTTLPKSSVDGGRSKSGTCAETTIVPSTSMDATSVTTSHSVEGTGNGSGLSLSLMQSSPPPHSYRHSRAYRHFKNPPQPHMCIRTTTEVGEELFINVLSWTRIVIPQEPSDPIPLYGGMRVPPGSPRSPPVVFAVMANPEVLKDSGRHSKDPEERRAMVELMCDFVEAMNPGVKLVRNAVILKDRDISGELKDVWNAVQAQRDREREEQMLQQRQQQHYHNMTAQQMYPKATENMPTPLERLNDSLEKGFMKNDIKICTSSSPLEQKVEDTTQVNNKDVSSASGNPSSDNVMSEVGMSIADCKSEKGSNQPSRCEPPVDQIDSCKKPATAKVAASANACATNIAPGNVDNNAVVSAAAAPAPAPATTASAAASHTDTSAVPPKKEKLGGFLPNGCIFPRFKHKHKDKEKDIKSKDKEKTLLNALKKSKDKKIAPIEQTEKNSAETEAKTQYEKNCINLEHEMQRLDINSSNDSIFIKLKVTPSSTAAK